MEEAEGVMMDRNKLKKAEMGITSWVQVMPPIKPVALKTESGRLQKQQG